MDADLLAFRAHPTTDVLCRRAPLFLASVAQVGRWLLRADPGVEQECMGTLFLYLTSKDLTPPSSRARHWPQTARSGPKKRDGGTFQKNSRTE